MKKLISLVMVVGVVLLFSGCAAKKEFFKTATFYNNAKKSYVKDEIELKKDKEGIDIQVRKVYQVPLYKYDIYIHYIPDRNQDYIEKMSGTLLFGLGCLPVKANKRMNGCIFSPTTHPAIKKENYRKYDSRFYKKYKTVTENYNDNVVVLLDEKESKKVHVKTQTSIKLSDMIQKYSIEPSKVDVTVKSNKSQKSITLNTQDIKNMNIKNETWEMDDFLLNLGQ